jgi:hypothetical protein
MAPLELSDIICGARTRLSMIDFEKGIPENIIAKEAWRLVIRAKLSESIPSVI